MLPGTGGGSLQLGPGTFPTAHLSHMQAERGDSVTAGEYGKLPTDRLRERTPERPTGDQEDLRVVASALCRRPFPGRT